jgi:hypothetical protein
MRSLPVNYSPSMVFDRPRTMQDYLHLHDCAHPCPTVPVSVCVCLGIYQHVPLRGPVPPLNLTFQDNTGSTHHHTSCTEHSNGRVSRSRRTIRTGTLLFSCCDSVCFQSVFHALDLTAPNSSSVADVHEMVVVQSWNCIMEYENMYKKSCAAPKLARFEGVHLPYACVQFQIESDPRNLHAVWCDVVTGRDGDYSLKAKMLNYFGVNLPFDR